jgi:hypothetical protein
MERDVIRNAKHAELLLVHFLMRRIRVVPGLIVLGLVGCFAGINPDDNGTRSIAVSKDARRSLPYASVLKAKSKVSPAAGKVVFRVDLQEAIPSIGANNSYELGFTG